MGNIGTIVVGDRTFRITSVIFRDGLMVIRGCCTDKKRHKAVSGMLATVFGTDGQGVCQGWDDFEIPETEAGRPVDIILPLRITTVETEKEA